MRNSFAFWTPSPATLQYASVPSLSSILIRESERLTLRIFPAREKGLIYARFEEVSVLPSFSQDKHALQNRHLAASYLLPPC